MILAYKLIFLTVSSLSAIVSVAADDTGFAVLSYQCSSDAYSMGALYGDAVSAVIRALVDSTADFGYDCSAQSRPSDPGDPVCFSHVTCHVGIVESECATCIQYAANFLGNRCPMSYGARTQVQSCRVRYERYPFTESK
ncbi:antifungal protein ginkbilobin-like protein [Eucalyptus grandis]|uniref:antifungal protein ginkbilobin-like protein n=1 Tax=Eucalyptus grandis TaxID=71139 RepID=UPI00192EBBC9|nr:antifungal protein ginkbilobin-like protein [Eucalyptus grandis]